MIKINAPFFCRFSSQHCNGCRTPLASQLSPSIRRVEQGVSLFASGGGGGQSSAGAGSRSALGNSLRKVPVLGGILGGLGEVASGVGNIALGNFSAGGSQSLGGNSRTRRK